MDRAEVVVVGAGLAGGSVAWHLASEVDVLLLEQGAAPGLEQRPDWRPRPRVRAWCAV